MPVEAPLLAARQLALQQLQRHPQQLHGERAVQQLQ
jgi:hypothetical protein